MSQPECIDIVNGISGAAMALIPNSILIVEDETPLADNIRVYLERNQWKVHVADSAKEGLKMVAKIHPDLVLIDFRLPGISGLAVIFGASNLKPQMKALMMTGEGNIDVMAEAMNEGTFDYLEKPFPLLLLNNMLEHALGRSRGEKTLSNPRCNQLHCTGLGKSQEANINRSLAFNTTRIAIRKVPVVEQSIYANPPSITVAD